MTRTRTDFGPDLWVENPFKDAKKVKEYLLDNYSTDFILWFKEQVGVSEFKMLGDTPIITDDFKRLLETKMTGLHTTFRQLNDAKTVKEYLLDTYSMDFVLWVKEVMGSSAFSDFGKTPIATVELKKSLNIKMTELHTLFQQREILLTVRDFASDIKELFSR